MIVLNSRLYLACPCLNGGGCLMNTMSCKCVGNWEGRICDQYGFPRDVAGITSFVAQSVGCTVVIVLVSVTVGCYLIVRDTRAQSVMILVSDISGLILHILIATCRSPFISGLSDFSCKIVSLAVQFSSLTHLSFLFLQSFHSYALTTGLSTGGWWPLPAPATLLTGILIPTVTTAANGIFFFSDLSLKWTCLLNYDSPLSRIFLISAISLLILILILSESAAMKSRELKLLLNIDRKDWLSAQFGIRSTSIIAILSFAAILTISLAVYSVSIPLFTIGFISNITFSSFLFFFHSIENAEIRQILRKIWKCSTNKKSTPETEKTNF